MKKGKKITRNFLKKQLVWYSFILVSILTLLILTYIPMLTTIKYSFYNVSMLGFSEKFNGLTNYSVIFHNNNFVRSVGNTFVLALMGLLAIPLGFILASLINGLGKNLWQSFFRVGFYFPNIITGVSVILVFQVVLKTDGGMVNSFLSHLLGTNIKIGWLSDSHYAKFGATILYIWQNLGYNMLVSLANLQSIPQEIYEAAEADGANSFQRWFYITIPQMKSCFSFLFITGMINGLARFTDLFIIGGNTPNGRPGGTLQTILMFIYQFSFENPQYGIASAGAMLLFAITFIITLINMRTTGFFRKEKR